MKDILGKSIGFLLGVFLLYPILGIVNILIMCRNLVFSFIISAFTFYLILGFTGVSCFLALILLIILKSSGDFLYKKSLKYIDSDIEKKINSLSDDERSQHKRGSQIDRILGKW